MNKVRFELRKLGKVVSMNEEAGTVTLDNGTIMSAAEYKRRLTGPYGGPGDPLIDSSCNGLGQFAALHTQPMTAADLAKMLAGWPEGARPSFFTTKHEVRDRHDDFLVGDIFGGDTLRSVAMHEAIDLACMAGMRWLSQQKPPDDYYTRVYRVEFWTSPDGGSVVRLSWTTDGGMGTREEHRNSLGPTILHAIDAAIRASK